MNTISIDNQYKLIISSMKSVDDWITISHITEMCGAISRVTVSKRLSELVERGDLKTKQEKVGGKWARLYATTDHQPADENEQEAIAAAVDTLVSTLTSLFQTRMKAVIEERDALASQLAAIRAAIGDGR